MKTPPYIIGTGFFVRPEEREKATDFFNIWYQNTFRYAKPEQVYVLANGGSFPHFESMKPDRWLAHIEKRQWIRLAGNLGHAHEVNTGLKPHAMCGWSAAFVTLAMLAYSDERDFFFKEQDCLAFGPWVERMYAEIGNRGMIFGSNQYACAQSLVLIRHAFIPEFVRLYLGEGSEQEKRNECEWKFKRLEQRWPDLFGRFSFGVDRMRPIPYDAEVFYAQQLQAGEMAELKSRGLI